LSAILGSTSGPDISEVLRNVVAIRLGGVIARNFLFGVQDGAIA